MYPFSTLPKPLRTSEFYVLLALARKPLHAYGVKGQIHKDSLGSVAMSDSQLYPLLARLHDEALIELEGELPAGKSGKERLHYTISKYGLIRLQEEFKRLDHAVKIIKNAGLVEDQTPTDIQRLLSGL